MITIEICIVYHMLPKIHVTKILSVFNIKHLYFSNSPPTRFEDEDFNYNSKPVEGWHGGGNYENFEVKYTREPPRHFTEPYPDFRLPVSTIFCIL